MLQQIVAMLLLALVSLTQAQTSGSPPSTLLNINNLTMWVRADGITARNPYNGSSSPDWGLLYPQELPAGLVFLDGFVWGGIVNDGEEPALRVGGHTLISGLRPGAIMTKGVAEDPGDPQINRVWRYRKDWSSADLTSEARSILLSQAGAVGNPPVQAIVDSLRQAYQKDREDWPWQKGAPFYDSNNNGTMESNEEPGLLEADQVVWYVANDLDRAAALALYGAPPIGIEMQVTLWAYNDDENISNTIFRRVRLIYKGTSQSLAQSRIDSMALAFYVESDIGSAGDDLAGTDTTLQMIYSYNGTTLDLEYWSFQSPPPALGYALLQGPIVNSANPQDRGRFNSTEHLGFSNLPMTGTWIDVAGDFNSQPSRGRYEGSRQYFNVLYGFRPRPESSQDPFRDPSGNPTRFQKTGDPITGTGWIDDFPNNRQLTLVTGDFAMALGDTQEVILAVTAGRGADHLASLEVMKFYAGYARDFAQHNFVTGVREPNTGALPHGFRLAPVHPNPFQMSAFAVTSVDFELPVQSAILLEVYDLLGRRIHTLAHSTMAAGKHRVQWNGRTANGRTVPVGIYWLRLEAGALSSTQKLIVIR